MSHDMLFENLHGTFTHVRAYELESEDDDHLRVLLAFPQMSGKDVLVTMQGTKKLIWRADFLCPSHSQI
ncbi:cation transport ATPase [Vibrio furnissii CIP 102972]|nr:cation transport ATPase [Vibrio furnissii CIP 102972]